MNLLIIVGYTVKHKNGETGKIIDVNDKYITVDYGNRNVPYNIESAFLKGTIFFEDKELQNKVEEEIKKKKIDKKNNEDFRKTAEHKKLSYFKRDHILTYKEVEEKFGVKISGGINTTDNAIILISSKGKTGSSSVYLNDYTDDGDYIYSGEGTEGDQKLTRGNLAIENSTKEGKPLHLFIKFSPKEYYYQGKFCYVNRKIEDEKDDKGNSRKVYKFRLKKISD